MDAHLGLGPDNLQLQNTTARRDAAHRRHAAGTRAGAGEREGAHHGGHHRGRHYCRKCKCW
jgi:hypothetical protein